MNTFTTPLRHPGVTAAGTARAGSGRRNRFTRPILALGLLLGLAASSCTYYYTSSVQGFVVDDDSGNGINSATVYLYYADPGDAASLVADPDAPAEFIAATTTSTSNNQAGYFSCSVIWQNNEGRFGEEGDTTTLWALVVHEDYAPKVVRFIGIFSESGNTVPDVELTSIVHVCPELGGRVLNASGEGVDGVRLALDLSPGNGTDDTDYLVTTQTVDGVAGSFTFENISWEGTADTDIQHAAEVRVDDTDWESAGTYPITLVDDNPVTFADPLSVYRQARNSFNLTLSGSLIKRSYASNGTVQEFGKSGIQVSLSYDTESQAADGSISSAAKTDVVSTAGDGSFSISAVWNDYGDKSNPSGVAIPEGEDEQAFSLSFNVGDGQTGWGWFFNDVQVTPVDGVITLTSADLGLWLRTWTNNVLPDGVYEELDSSTPAASARALRLQAATSTGAGRQ